MARPLARTSFARALSAAPVVALLSCGGGGGGGGGGRGAPDPVDLASVTPNPVAAATSTPAGEFAADYLRATHFDEIVVEVDYPADRPPIPAALDLLAQRLSERCDKPGGVQVVVDDPIPVEEFGTRLNTSAIEALEDAWRDVYSDQPAGIAAMYVLYVHGRSALDTQTQGVIGLSYRGGSFVLFVDRVGETSIPPAVTDAEVEAASLVHESGHLLGLVNNGVPMVQPHEDPEHGFHDVDPDCVMYFLIEVPLVTPNLGDPGFMDFDAHCVADLQAFGGLGPLPALVRPRAAAGGGASERVTVGACGCAGCLPGRARPSDGR